jgi:hypothetical protein
MACFSALKYLAPFCLLAPSLCLSSCGGSSESGDVGSRSGDPADAGAKAGENATGPADDDTSDDAGATTVDDTSAGDVTGADDDASDDDVSAADDDTAPTDITPAQNADAGAVVGTIPGPVDLPTTDVSSLEPPMDLLPDTPPETPVSDLTDDEFSDLCNPYLDEATTTVSTLDALCGFQGISAANDSNAATLEEFRAACGEARIQCESDTAAAQVLADSLECTRPADCTATVAEVDACYQQLYMLNAAILGPLDGTEFPPCEELTPTQAGVITAQVLLYLVSSSAQASDATGTPVDLQGDACASLDQTCPGLAAPGDIAP